MVTSMRKKEVTVAIMASMATDKGQRHEGKGGGRSRHLVPSQSYQGYPAIKDAFLFWEVLSFIALSKAPLGLSNKSSLVRQFLSANT